MDPRKQRLEQKSENAIVPVALRHHVVAIFAGHDHFYERGIVDGLPYIVSGGGGVPVSRTATRRPETQQLIFAHHHVRVRVAGSSVSMQAVSPDGQILDDVTLR